MKYRLNSESGFTLVELLLAMTVFSAVMVIATVGFIGMNRTFARGVIRKELFDYSQSATEEITRTIRDLGKNANITSCTTDPSSCSALNKICLGTSRYVWVVDSNDAGLYKDKEACSNNNVGDNPKEIVSDRYVVRSFDVTAVDSSGDAPEGLFKVSGVFTTADDEALVLDPGNIRCRGTAEVATVRTCAVQKFSFVINSRGE